MSRIGARIRAIRKSRNETPEAFADLLGCSGKHLRNLELGHRHPTEKFLDRIVQLQEMSPDEAKKLMALAGYGKPVEFKHPLIDKLADVLQDEQLNDRLRQNLEEDISQLIDSWMAIDEARQQQYRRNWEKAGEICAQTQPNVKHIASRFTVYALDIRAAADIHLGKIDAVKRAHKTIEKHLKRMDDPLVGAFHHIHKGDYYRDQGKWEDAQASYSLGLNSFDRQGSRRRSAWARRKISLVYLFQGDWMQARSSLLGCLKEFQHLEDVYEEAKTHYALGWVYNLSGEWEKAHDHHLKGMRLAAERQKALQWPDTYFEMLGHAYQGNDLRQFGKEQEAENSLRMALNISKGLGEKRERGWIYLGLARIYAKRAKRQNHGEDAGEAEPSYQRALDYFRKSEESNQEIGYQYRQVMTLAHYAHMELERRNTAVAIESLLKAQIIAQRIECHYYESQINMLLCEAYRQEGQYEEIEVLVGKVEDYHKQFRYYNHMARLKVIEAKAVIDQGVSDSSWEIIGHLFAASFQYALRFNQEVADEIFSEFRAIVLDLTSKPVSTRHTANICRAVIQELGEWEKEVKNTANQQKPKILEKTAPKLDGLLAHVEKNSPKNLYDAKLLGDQPPQQ